MSHVSASPAIPGTPDLDYPVPPDPEGQPRERKCTAARAKSIIKNIFAQLFSHVGLCLLVAGYSLMGAVLFVSLEKQNELDTRTKVSNARNHTLDELYNLTAFLRLEVIIQEEKILKLQDKVKQLTKLNKNCDRHRKKDRQFLQSLIETSKRDNVQLSESQCTQFCLKNKIKDCELLCSSSVAYKCSKWPHKCKKVAKRSVASTSEDTESYGSHYSIPDKIFAMSNNQSSNVINQKVFKELSLRTWSAKASCSSITCIVEPGRKATFCFQYTDPEFHFQFGQHQETKKKFNVLWRENWTLAAGKVLRHFEQEVIKKTKSEGYDGQEDKDRLQWSFSGALLYSVTVITTIGYGNIAPKTSYGRVATILYAILGMPLFLLWASQMGTLLAHLFKFLYYNICCGLCRRGKRRKALALVAKTRKQEEKLMMMTSNELAENGEERPQVLFTENLGTLRTPKTSLHDSGVHSQQSLAKATGQQLQQQPVKIEILQPDVKELLSTCAQYNIEATQNGEIDSRSAEVLEEIRHAEVIETIRAANKARSNANGTASVPMSPLKMRPLGACKEDLSSLYDNNGSPDKDMMTPVALRKARLGHGTVVSLDANGGSAITSLVKGRSSREASPASSFKGQNRSLSRLPQTSVDPSVILAESLETPERIPVMPVLIFICGYFFLGATIFSNWEGWSLLEGFYFSFITLTTIGFGDFVPGDAVLSTGTEEGTAKLIIACVYLLMGLAILSMAINLMQDTIREKAKELAIELGIIDDPNAAADDQD